MTSKIILYDVLLALGTVLYLITSALRELRWLPVTSFLKYTLGVLAFKCVKGLATFVIDLRHVIAFMTVILDIRIT